jgi:hypothetical protein
MTTGLSVRRQDVRPGHIVFTRSDGEVFELVWSESGQASLFQKDRPPPEGISLDVCIPDKHTKAEALILAYPTGWP